MRDQTNTAVSQKTLVILGAPTSLLISTLYDYSDTVSVFVSSDTADSPPIGYQEDPIGSKCPKVSMASYIHTFDPEELRSILLSITQTLQTPNQTHGTSFDHARTKKRPHLTTGQGDQGSSGNPTLPLLQSSGLGMVRTVVQGSTNPGDTLV